jgi:hypothetical protein
MLIIKVKKKNTEKAEKFVTKTEELMRLRTGLKTFAKIDMSSLDQSTRPKKKFKEECPIEREEKIAPRFKLEVLSNEIRCYERIFELLHISSSNDNYLISTMIERLRYLKQKVKENAVSITI